MQLRRAITDCTHHRKQVLPWRHSDAAAGGPQNAAQLPINPSCMALPVRIPRPRAECAVPAARRLLTERWRLDLRSLKALYRRSHFTHSDACPPVSRLRVRRRLAALALLPRRHVHATDARDSADGFTQRWPAHPDRYRAYAWPDVSNPLSPNSARRPSALAAPLRPPAPHPYTAPQRS